MKEQAGTVSLSGFKSTFTIFEKSIKHVCYVWIISRYIQQNAFIYLYP